MANPIFERILALKNIKRESVKALFGLGNTAFMTQDFSQMDKFLHFTVGYDLQGLIEIALGENLRIREHTPLKSYAKHIAIYFEGNTFTSNERFEIASHAKQTFLQSLPLGSVSPSWCVPSGSVSPYVIDYIEANGIESVILHFPNIAEALKCNAYGYALLLQQRKIGVLVSIAGEKVIEMPLKEAIINAKPKGKWH